MVAVLFALVPAVESASSRLVGAAVLVPFLLTFGWDWLAVSGRIDPDSAR
ncbi:hypothetical protein SAMN05444422_10756 [Halobiforma haloterrestris]|uniref:Uncharacterized protein n=2 Tax=Natronobacterium haloterrestre TaxID=148448 RepID=A0A1I1IAV3_NATHA|nr:hypothetical protein SAMN05444422_10756 [Halobiforma haloterrestris]